MILQFMDSQVCPKPQKCQQLPDLPSFGVRPKKEEIQVKTQYLLDVQVDRVLSLLMPQNRLIMEVCLHTGLRIGDVVSLKSEKITTKFWITEQKTGKRRMVGLTRDLVYRIKQQAGTYWAFPSPQKHNAHKTRQAVWADVKRAAIACRLPQNVASHSFRKVYSVALLEKYGDLDRVRRALNHSSAAVTLIYAMADKLLMESLQEGRKSRKRKSFTNGNMRA